MGYTLVTKAGNDERPNERPEPKEVVGSTNLREVILDQGFIAGSFSINGVQFRDFKATSPGDVVRQINASGSPVKAELDDGYHLVLVNYSGGDIVVGDGSAYDRYVEVSSTPNMQISPMDEYFRGKLREEHNRKSAVEALGLEANEEAAFGPGDSSDWSPGENAEERAKRREAWMKQESNDKGIVWDRRSTFGGDSTSDEYLRSLNQGKTGGGTTQMNRGPSDVISNDPNNPQTTSNAVPGTVNNPQGSDQKGLSPAQNVQPGSRENPGVEGLKSGQGATE